LSGEATTTLAIAKPGVSQSGNQYRALFTNTCGGAQSAASNAATLTVAAKAITVIPNSGQSKQYGASDPSLTYSSSPDLESGDGFNGALGRAAGENVDSYAITLGNLSAGPNYNLSLSAPAVNFVITKKAASVTAEDKSKVYGSDDPALTTTDSGFLAGDLGSGKITFSASRAAGESVAGGPYAITPSASDGATSLLGNYDVTYKTGQLTITAKAITVKADDKTKVYGSPDPALTVSVPAGALESGDSLSGSLSREPGESVAGSPYAITQGSLTAGGNYELTVTPGTFTITKKAITVAADDKSKVYGSADPALTVTVPPGALESGDSLSGSLVRASGNNVGGYAITQGSLTAGGNYELTVTPGTLTITKKDASLTAEDKSKVYGAADPALTTVDSGFLAGDLGSGKITFGVSRAAGESVAGGPYTITPSASDGATSLLGNYDVTYNTGKLTITKKPITVTADPQSKVVGASDPALTYKVTSSSLESGDSISGALTRAPGEAIGTYAITQGTLTAGGNYDLKFVGSTLKIVYDWDGFLQPINDTAHQTGVQESKFKLGQTIPAKFVLKNAAGAVVQQASAPTFSRSGNLGTCDNTATTDTTEVVTPDAGVAYSWDGSQYHYNWSTKNLAAGEYRIYANLADGTKPYVDICLTK
jgi:hypothetical protein